MSADKVISIFILTLLTTLPPQFSGRCGIQDKEQSKLRDLSRYDKEGPYDAGPYMEKANATLEKLRGFLWDHWHQRRLGYIVTIFYSKEGERSTSHDFVEQDELGEWHISVRIERQLLDREHWAKTKSVKYFSEVNEYKAYFLERISVTKSKQRISKIPKYEKRSPNSYILRLKDKKGKWLADI